jgi:hypothetical protein
MAENFAETEVLVAIMDGDVDAADLRLDDFLPNELDAFERHAYQLADRIRRARARQFAPNTP